MTANLLIHATNLPNTTQKSEIGESMLQPAKGTFFYLQIVKWRSDLMNVSNAHVGVNLCSLAAAVAQ